MDTSQIMQLALDMSGFKAIPPDSGIWVPGKEIRKALFAIDAGTPELLLAKEHGYDAVIAHHPVGPARLTFSSVVRRHLDFMLEKGVPKEVAEAATEELVDRVEVRAHPYNYMHDVEFAKSLGMPYMNIHLPIDQITRNALLGAIGDAKAATVGELVLKLQKIREFRDAKTKIEVRMGESSSRLGNWVLLFAAGTNGGYPIARAYFEHGLDTVIYLHVDYDELSRMRKDLKGNLIVLGHMAGDSIGANQFIEKLTARGVEVDTLGVIG